jgi:hypothetical protein
MVSKASRPPAKTSSRQLNWQGVKRLAFSATTVATLAGSGWFFNTNQNILRTAAQGGNRPTVEALNGSKVQENFVVLKNGIRVERPVKASQKQRDIQALRALTDPVLNEKLSGEFYNKLSLAVPFLLIDAYNKNPTATIEQYGRSTDGAAPNTITLDSIKYYQAEMLPVLKKIRDEGGTIADNSLWLYHFEFMIEAFRADYKGSDASFYNTSEVELMNKQLRALAVSNTLGAELLKTPELMMAIGVVDPTKGKVLDKPTFLLEIPKALQGDLRALQNISATLREGKNPTPAALLESNRITLLTGVAGSEENYRLFSTIIETNPEKYPQEVRDAALKLAATNQHLEQQRQIIKQRLARIAEQLESTSNNSLDKYFGSEAEKSWDAIGYAPVTAGNIPIAKYAHMQPYHPFGQGCSFLSK